MFNIADEIHAKQVANEILVRTIELMAEDNKKLKKNNRELERELERKDLLISTLKKELYHTRLREQTYRICCMGDRHE